MWQLWTAGLQQYVVALIGQVFGMGKGPQPPQHFNCRSTIVPIIKDDFWTGLV